MLSDFIPVPSIGSHYKFPDGKIIVVKYLVPEEPDIEESVGYAYTSNPSDEKEAVLDEWNSWELTSLSNEDLTGSDPLDNGDHANSDGEDGEKEPDTSSKKTTQEDPQTNSTDSEPHNKSRSDGMDPKLQELEDFLRKGPEINAQFLPFNYKVESNDVEENDIIEGYNRTLQEIDDIRAKGKSRPKNFVNEFLWTCGGLDKNLLRMFPADWAKKAGMGGTILGTAVLATFSGGYAAYTVSENPFLALVIGVIWGLVIFNLDRYLVNSMYSDGEPTISKQEFLSGLPRIIIAFFLGIVISIPIELKIFEGEINQYINAENISKIKTNEQGDKDISDLEKDLSSQRSILLEMQRKYQEYQDTYNNEVSKGGGGRIKGEGPVARALKADRDNYMKNILSPQREKVKQIESDLRNLKKVGRTNTINNNKKEQGLSKKIEMLIKATSFYVNKLDENGNPVFTKDGQGKITNEVIKEFNPLWLVRILISLMFIILEILPVVNKMMQTDGEYDRFIDLESDTMDKLARAKEVNNINILRSGRLSRYKSYILGKKIKEFEDDNLEDNIGFTKKEPLREDKNTTDNNNQEIFNEAQALAKAYAISKMRKIFGDIPPIYSQPVAQTTTNSASGDPSSQAKVI